MASLVKSALPSHLKSTLSPGSNGEDAEFQRHHGKTRSHMVSNGGSPDTPTSRYPPGRQQLAARTATVAPYATQCAAAGRLPSLSFHSATPVAQIQWFVPVSRLLFGRPQALHSYDEPPPSLWDRVLLS